MPSPCPQTVFHETLEVGRATFWCVPCCSPRPLDIMQATIYQSSSMHRERGQMKATGGTITPIFVLQPSDWRQNGCDSFYWSRTCSLQRARDARDCVILHTIKTATSSRQPGFSLVFLSSWPTLHCCCCYIHDGALLPSRYTGKSRGATSHVTLSTIKTRWSSWPRALLLLLLARVDNHRSLVMSFVSGRGLSTVTLSGSLLALVDQPRA